MTAHHHAFLSLCKQIVRSGERREDPPTQEELEFWEGADAMDKFYGKDVVFLDEWVEKHPR